MIKKMQSGYLFLLIIILLSITVFTGCYNKKADLIIPNNDCDTSVAISYSQDITNILRQNCYMCHSAEKYSTAGGNNQLDTYLSLQTLVTNHLLLKAINHSTDVTPMPLGAAKLSDCDIMKITAWVNRGAPNN